MASPSLPKLVLQRPDGNGPGTAGILIFGMVLVALSAGREVFIPMALALLLSVALMPLANRMQRIGVPRIPAVLLLLLLSLGIICAVLLLFVSQALTLAGDLPAWEQTLRAKLQALSDGSGVLERAFGTLQRLSEELGRRDATPAPAVVAAAPPTSPLATMFQVAGVVLAPIASLAVAMLLLTFLLVQREDVRDRVLRLAGTGDIHRTTRAMADATERVGRYLLVQLLINGGFGLAMGLGLVAIGVPNAPLWGLLFFVMRFVPFLGVWLALLLPLLVTFATTDGWAVPLLVLALFASVDVMATYILEPWLYGSTTGITPLALLVSSAVWTVLWGPVGLILAPPITACLVILGRHVPALNFLEVLLGDRAPLPEPLRFYQRCLARDETGVEAVAIAHAAATDLGATLRELALPAIETARQDRRAGHLTAADAAEIAGIVGRLARRLGDADQNPSALQGASVALLPVAGPLDQALAEVAGALLRHEGHPEAAMADMALVCAAEASSPTRLRRALAEARRRAAHTAALTIGEDAAGCAGGAGATPVLRGAEALLAWAGASRPQKTAA
ncbi:MAG TPA: AI-2E family transporter [Roseomonas sp.]